MNAVKKGEAHVTARARLMLLLGEQLITDEVAAISELVKNAYDADATKVVVTLFHISDPKTGHIVIRDNGHGMTSDVVLSSWLELGTLSKARGTDLKPRFSEKKKRPFLGEKGLGRLAVHKLGHRTELITRRIDADVETRLTIDWTAFEKSEGFLEEVPVNWEETSPNVFTESEFLSGTQITIRELQRAWNKDMIERTERSLRALKSPFKDLSDFDIIIKIEDDLAPIVRVHDMSEIIDKATYTFIGEIDEAGQLDYRYKFQRDDYPALSREVKGRKDARDPELFSNDRKPICGPIHLRFYSWDLSPQDQRAVLGDTQTYKEMIEPNTGIKVFRDGFRVLPYGNPDNDWLGMDLRRVRQFEERLSRNQAIGAVEISARTNPRLLDKTDREGLIDNEALRDFHSLVQNALTQFEAERYPDRRNLKEVTGRLLDRETDRTRFA